MSNSSAPKTDRDRFMSSFESRDKHYISKTAEMLECISGCIEALRIALDAQPGQLLPVHLDVVNNMVSMLCYLNRYGSPADLDDINIERVKILIPLDLAFKSTDEIIEWALSGRIKNATTANENASEDEFDDSMLASLEDEYDDVKLDTNVPAIMPTEQPTRQQTTFDMMNLTPSQQQSLSYSVLLSGEFSKSYH